MGQLGRLLLLVVLVCCTLCSPAISAKPPARQPAKSSVKLQTTVDDYIKLYRNGDIDQRYEALDALRRSKDPGVFQALLTLLKDTSIDEDASDEIVSVLSSKMKNLDTGCLIQLFGAENRELRWNATRVIRERGPALRDKLAASLDDRNPLVRAHAAVLLLAWMDERGLQPALNALNDPNPEVRLAATSMTNVVDPRATQIMKRLLKDENNYVRTCAVGYLSKLRDPELLDNFTDIVLNDKDAQVRSAAAQAIGLIGDAHSVPTLIRVIKSDDIAQDAAQALFQISDPEAVPQLVVALEDKSPAVRAIAIQCLLSFNDDQADNAVLAVVSKRSGREEENKVYYDLPRSVEMESINEFVGERRFQREMSKREYLNPPSFGSVDIPKLVASVRNPDPEICQRAIHFIKGMKDKDTVEPLISLMDDKNPDVQNNAAYLLGFISDERACKPLEEKVKKGGRLAITAARAMQRLGRYETVSNYVIQLLNDKNSGVRTGAAVVVGDAKDVGALDILLGKIKDTDPDFHKAVVFALSRIDGPKAAEAVASCLGGSISGQGGDRDGVDRRYSFEFDALSRMAARATALPRLLELLKSPNIKVKVDAALLLGEIKDKAAVEPLKSLMADPKVKDKSRADYVSKTAAIAIAHIGEPETVPLLIEAAQNESDRDSSITGALGSIHDERVYQYLMKLLNSPFVSQWTKAAVALGEMRDPRAADALADRSKMSNEAAFALAKLGDKRAYAPIVRLLWVDSGKTRKLVDAMGDLADPRCVDYLARIYYEHQDHYGAPVAAALSKIKCESSAKIIYDILLYNCQSFSPVILTSMTTQEDGSQQIGYFKPTEVDEVQMAIFPALAAVTGQHFGQDAGKWISWRKSEKQAAVKTGDAE